MVAAKLHCSKTSESGGGRGCVCGCPLPCLGWHPEDIESSRRARHHHAFPSFVISMFGAPLVRCCCGPTSVAAFSRSTCRWSRARHPAVTPPAGRVYQKSVPDIGQSVGVLHEGGVPMDDRESSRSRENPRRSPPRLRDWRLRGESRLRLRGSELGWCEEPMLELMLEVDADPDMALEEPPEEEEADSLWSSAMKLLLRPRDVDDGHDRDEVGVDATKWSTTGGRASVGGEGMRCRGPPSSGAGRYDTTRHDIPHA